LEEQPGEKADNGCLHAQPSAAKDDHAGENDVSEAELAWERERSRCSAARTPQSHIDYVIEVCEYVADLLGYRIVAEPPAVRHFMARFEPAD
jgi:tryptophanase